MSQIHKIPITILSKIFSFLKNIKMFVLRKTPFNKQNQQFFYEKEDIQNEIDEQQKVDW